MTSDMHMIQQENPRGTKTTKGRRFTEDDDEEGSFNSKSDRENIFFNAKSLFIYSYIYITGIIHIFIDCLRT